MSSCSSHNINEAVDKSLSSFLNQDRIVVEVEKKNIIIIFSNQGLDVTCKKYFTAWTLSSFFSFI